MCAQRSDRVAARDGECVRGRTDIPTPIERAVRGFNGDFRVLCCWKMFWKCKIRSLALSALLLTCSTNPDLRVTKEVLAIGTK